MKSFEELKPIAEGYLQEQIAAHPNAVEFDFPFTEEGVRYEARYTLAKEGGEWTPEFIKPAPTSNGLTV
jgi:hypothetical protein